MAHNLHIRNGKAAMMYVGETPWHGLGTELKAPATSAEAIKAAGLDWEVALKPVCAADVGGIVRVPDRYAVVREDEWGKPDCTVFGVVGKDYRPLQNREAFAFFDDIVGKNAAIYHTAGALGRGERVWILAKLLDGFVVAGDDVEKYLLLSNSHDGSSAVQIKFTPIRVVCQNTLIMALNDGPTIRVPHLGNVQQRLRAAEENLGIIRTRYTQIEELFCEFAKVSMCGDRLDVYLSRIYPDPPAPVVLFEDEYFRSLDRVRKQRERAAEHFEAGKGNARAGVSGTLWAAYNGVAEYVDYEVGNQQVPDRHLGSIWFGTGADVKVKAFRIAEKCLDEWRN